jgi:hypothetical protein
MNRCSCQKKLDGQPGDVAPPGDMTAVGQYFSRNGIFEVYRCRSCASRWERFVSSEKVGAQSSSGPWKHLKAQSA